MTTESFEIKRIFIFCVTLLQNSLTLKEFEDNLTDIFKIFCFKSSSEDIVLEVNRKINKRNFDPFEFLSNYEYEISPNQEQFDIHIENNVFVKIKKDSRFRIYFENKINDLSNY